MRKGSQGPAQRGILYMDVETFVEAGGESGCGRMLSGVWNRCVWAQGSGEFEEAWIREIWLSRGMFVCGSKSVSRLLTHC